MTELNNQGTNRNLTVIIGDDHISARSLLGDRISIPTFCAGEVNTLFGKNALEYADLIVIANDMEGDINRGARGFMAVNKLNDDYLYIELICNAIKPKIGDKLVELRSSVRKPGGRDMLDWLMKYVESSENSYVGIALKALTAVIPYYYRFGWRFRDSCSDRDERDWTAGDVEALGEALRESGENEYDPLVQKRLKPFRRFVTGLSDVAERTRVIHDILNYDEEQLDSENVYIDTKLDEGYPMLWCVAGTNSGGSKKKNRSINYKMARRKTRKRMPWAGWGKLAPKGHQRTVMKRKCGKKCFLGPKKSFPICAKGTCKVNKKGLYAAYIRARQWGKRRSSYKSKGKMIRYKGKSRKVHMKGSRPRHERRTYTKIARRAKRMLRHRGVHVGK